MTWQYFNYTTDPMLACSCGRCKGNGMSPEFMDKLDRLREAYGKPITISSGYRCPEYNAKISTTGKTGPHTTGRAVDIYVRGEDALQLLTVVLNMKFTGIGVKQHGDGRFLHIDNAPVTPRPWIWSYK